ncbi:hypothetical protein N9045_01065 [bacterium]|nr:hypothetical protein [bacterium]
MQLNEISSDDYKIRPSQGDGWRIDTNYGYIDYRHDDYENVNEVWWVESKQRGGGSKLVDLMMKHHPAEAVSWGVTSGAGEGLMRKWHRNNPQIEMIHEPHEGQFDPF